MTAEIVQRRIGRLNVRETGPPDAPPVVLVQGLGLSGAYLVPLARRLAAAHRVLVPDLPGLGRTPRPPRPMGVTGLAGALATWLDAARLHRVALVGHSIGAQVAAVVAANAPARVDRLVLAAPNGDPDARAPWHQALDLLRDAPREAPSLVPLAVADYLHAGPWRMWRTLRTSARLDLAGYLRRVQAPALAVRGEHDPLVSEEWIRTIAGLLPAGAALTVPGAPHGIAYTAAADLAAHLIPFLRQDQPVCPTSWTSQPLPSGSVKDRNVS
ncbi:alpha/beta fold hydrolase [Actinomadura parmotrematis]|uniref:Alpha/beta hydrolase n=1 Tax=Actinomadura parmotrematis TaxID=2864039 RepID=A0ABS7FPE8_9ACTN|nr:alpha/beta hydrolase [Actinomadura parmotrematis]MBW8482095.1 alpha/beta hydrolase [Actinomadura parmotrematis]